MPNVKTHAQEPVESMPNVLWQITILFVRVHPGSPETHLSDVSWPLVPHPKLIHVIHPHVDPILFAPYWMEVQFVNV